MITKIVYIIYKQICYQDTPGNKSQLFFQKTFVQWNVQNVNAIFSFLSYP